MSLKLIGNITIFLSNNYVSFKNILQNNDFQSFYFSTKTLNALFFSLFRRSFLQNSPLSRHVFLLRSPPFPGHFSPPLPPPRSVVGIPPLQNRLSARFPPPGWHEPPHGDSRQRSPMADYPHLRFFSHSHPRLALTSLLVLSIFLSSSSVLRRKRKNEGRTKEELRNK